jgi:2-oxo-4-hydroxy-4-carboxy-5-ureidoimidazoline decarboxylase
MPRSASRKALGSTDYKSKHGFPFIACVRHYTKEGILYEFERRLANDSETELATDLEQIFAITRLRLNALFNAN